MFARLQVEQLDPPIDAQHRLNRPGPAQVQTGAVAHAVVGYVVFSQDGDVGVFAGIHGEETETQHDQGQGGDQDQQERSHGHFSLFSFSVRRAPANTKRVNH